ncbi:hypothetical protein WMF18_29495 [Sorangium sp. So ce315]|uniref:hypothetical protein n=1 Tax=Sorangium sp. So ce315 TaxID=3133299 RepID=UPI003F5ED151
MSRARAARRAAERAARKARGVRSDDVPRELEATVGALLEHLEQQGPPAVETSGLVLLAHDLEGAPSVDLVDRLEVSTMLALAGDSSLARKLAEPVPIGSITLLALARGGLAYRMRARWAGPSTPITAPGGMA